MTQRDIQAMSREMIECFEGEPMGHPSTEHPRANGVPVPRLATVRKRVGLSQRALAELAGVSEQTISRLEGGANARFTTIALLAQALHFPPARLLSRPHRKRSISAFNDEPTERK